VLEELLRREIARLPPIEDRLGNIRREVAEADAAREIRGSRSIGNTGRHCPGRRFAEEPGATRRKAIDLARQALQVGDNDPGILANAAFVLALFGEDIGAMIELADRALMLNPSFARGWYLSGVLRLFASKHDLAIEHIETSLRLSPGERMGQPLAQHSHRRRKCRVPQQSRRRG
jgi:tetratricopeptide (TPR) repeat protein